MIFEALDAPGSWFLKPKVHPTSHGELNQQKKETCDKITRESDMKYGWEIFTYIDSNQKDISFTMI